MHIANSVVQANTRMMIVTVTGSMLNSVYQSTIPFYDVVILTLMWSDSISRV